MSSCIRLDTYMFEKNFSDSRNKAKELIVAGKVLVDGEVCYKPSFKVEDVAIEILKDIIYVSRAGDKIDAFIKEVNISFIDKKCLDIGSSTGGFVQFLLLQGACTVTAVDVGSDQLHESLKKDTRVHSVEKTDIRDFTYHDRFDVVTCDVSFVGIEHILDDIDRLSKGDIIILFKPQFEVGKDVKRDKKGVVKDLKAIKFAQNKFECSCFAKGWNLQTSLESSIRGKEGNIEIFYYYTK